jgi:hypothetical protein
MLSRISFAFARVRERRPIEYDCPVATAVSAASQDVSCVFACARVIPAMSILYHGFFGKKGIVCNWWVIGGLLTLY